MKRLLIVPILVILEIGCASQTTQIKSSVNDYYFYANRFQDKCPSYDSTQCPQFKTEADNLKTWFKALKEAQEAATRGGNLPLQLKALKNIEGKVKANQ